MVLLMSDKDNKPPTTEEMEKTLKDLFGKMGGAFSMPFPGGGASSMDEPSEPAEGEREKIDSVESLLDFNYLPRDIKAHLDRYVIRQDEAKKALSIAVCDHYNHAKQQRLKEDGHDIEYQKQNVMVVGPTGVGKTYLVKHIADLIGVPFVKADATKFSETGYVGGDVDDLVRELVTKANGDVELAEYGIIYIDEIDKIASRSSQNGARDVSGKGVQTTLLKLMEETEVALRNPMDMKGQMMAMMDMQNGKGTKKDSINTRHILFIVSGAFSGIEKIISNRLRSGEIGFGAKQDESVSPEKLHERASTQDYIDYGFEAEFVGRLPIRVICEKLEAADFVNIMKFSEGSLLRQYEREFEAYGIRAKFEDDAIEVVAERAEKENTGARALMTVCASILREFKYELPGTAVDELVINRKLIDEKEEVLESYRIEGRKVDIERVQREVLGYADDFYKKHSLKLNFDDGAFDEIAKLSSEQGRSALQVCRSQFKDYKFGLSLIKRNAGQDTFSISRDAVSDADKYLSELVVQSYEGKSAAGSSDSSGES